MILTLEYAELLVLLTKCTISSQLNVNVLKIHLKLMEFATNAQEILNMIQSLKHANVKQDIELMELETVSLDVELMKSSRMENAAVNQDIIPSMEFVEFVLGMKFMIKVSESVEFLVIQREYLTLARKLASASLNISRWLMEHVTDVLLTQLTQHKSKNAYVMPVTSRILVSVLPHAMLMNNMLMENVSVEKDIISLDIAVVFVLLLKFMMLPTESVMLLVKAIKFGIPSSDLADAFQDITLSMESALNVIQKLKFTTTESNVVIVKLDIEKPQVKVVKENVFLSAQLMKTSS